MTLLPVGDDGRQRVAKLMAWRGLCSRREAERLIVNGEVMVDGVVVREPGSKCLPDAAICLRSRGQRWLSQSVSVLLHKPCGVVSTQPEGDQVPAWQLLASDALHGPADPALVRRVMTKPWTLAVAGRLDRESRGLLLLTQDGTLARLVTGSGRIAKRYRVELAEVVGDHHLRALNRPMRLDDRPLRPMQVTRLGGRCLAFVLHEGRKHQIRRVCAALSLTVTDLLREAIGPCQLGDLPVGCWRPVRPKELEQLAADRRQPRGSGAGDG